MRLGFTGTRLGLTELQHATLVELLDGLDLDEDDEVHHGDCVGADAEFHKLVFLDTLATIYVHPPIYATLRAYCVGGGRVIVLPVKDYLPRNADIVAASELVIACPGGEHKSGGTWWTVREAKRKGVPVRVVDHTGKVVAQ